MEIAIVGITINPTKIYQIMVGFVILTVLCISSYANAIRCWQCAFVDGRKCPRDAKVTMICVFDNDYGLNTK